MIEINGLGKRRFGVTLRAGGGGGGAGWGGAPSEGARHAPGEEGTTFKALEDSPES